MYNRELVETSRRLLLTAVLSVIAKGNFQVIVGVLMAVLFMKLYGDYAPYLSNAQDTLQEMAQYQVLHKSTYFSPHLVLSLVL